MIGIAAMVAAQSMAFGLAINLSPPSGIERLVLHGALGGAAIIVFLLVGRPIVRVAWQASRDRRIVVEHLFLAGIFGAFSASVQATLSGTGSVYYEVVAVLVAIYTLGRVLSKHRMQGATAAAQRLRDEFSMARKVTCCGSIDIVEVTAIQPGETVRVLSGEGVPVDGRILDGTSYVRETALSGEIFPVVKRPGDEVLAGSIIEDGVLTIQASSAGDRRKLDEMLGALSEAAANKSAIQREADRIVAWFLPLVMTLSVIAFAVWTTMSGWQTGLFTAMSVLLVACPCAMGLATPIGIWGALNELARRGVVLKSGESIEALASVDTVVFDKTGTLSEESYAVMDAVVAAGFERDAVRRLVATLQTCSAHPVARAFADWAGPAPDGVVNGFRLLPGVGITGWINGCEVLVGNVESVRCKSATAQLEDLRDELPQTPGTHEFVVFVDGRLAMLVQMREQMRSSASEALKQFARWKIPVWIMTGDPAWDASRLPEVVPDQVLTGMSPQDKCRKVRELGEAGRRVLFVGDGINDAPAMAAAHASLALASGAGLSRSAASGELFGGQMPRTGEAINMCRRAIRSIHQNLIFASVYNFVGIGLALGGVLHPVVAALLMLGSSITVTTRAFRSGARLAAPIDGDSEDLAPAPVLPRRRVSASKSRDILTSVCIPAQGALIPALGGMSIEMYYLGVSVATAIAVLVSAIRPQMSTFALGLLRMASVGGFAMLIGWWADAGFEAVVRDGVCLCGCIKSDLGWGIIANLRWMDLAMIVSCMGFGLAPVGLRNIWEGGKWLMSFAGMLLGMKLGVLPLALVPVGNPHIFFSLTYFSMLIGMLLGFVITLRLIVPLIFPDTDAQEPTDAIEAAA